MLYVNKGSGRKAQGNTYPNTFVFGLKQSVFIIQLPVPLSCHVVVFDKEGSLVRPSSAVATATEDGTADQ